MKLNLTLVRYLTVAAIAIVLAVLLAVIGIAVARGTDITSTQLVSLIAFVGTLMGILAALVNGLSTASATQQQAVVLDDVRDKVNGHLERHLGHTDPQIEQIVADVLERRLGPPPPAAGGV